MFYETLEFYYTISFALFVLIFARKLGRVVAGVLDKEIQAIRTKLEEAKTLQREAQVLYVKEKSEELALQEALQIQLKNAEAALTTQAQQEKMILIARFQKDLELKELALKQKLNHEQAHLRLVAADTIRAIAHRVCQNLSPQTQQDLIDQAIASLPSRRE